MGMRRLSLSYLLQVGALVLFPLVSGGSDLMSAGLTPDAVYARLKTEQAPLVVDVRKPWEFNIAHIPGAINIPVTELEQHVAELRNANGVLIYCINGSRTREAEPILLNAGISPLYYLEGAFYAWIRSGLEVEKGPAGK
jgi:rhodanese-related sulfurtransferase